MITDPDLLEDVNTKCASKVLGVAGSTVRDMEKRGIIKKSGPKQGHWNLLELVPAYVKFRIGGRVESTRAKLTEQQERKLKLANDTTEGKLVRIEHASAVFAEYAASFRAGVTALPGRCSSQLAGMSRSADIRGVLTHEVNELLEVAERQLKEFLPHDEATSVRESGDADTEADTPKNSRPVGRRKSNTTKRKRRARKVA